MTADSIGLPQQLKQEQISSHSNKQGDGFPQLCYFVMLKNQK